MLQLINVSKDFRDIKAVCDVSLGVKSGERLVVLGPSGCGKTTLLRLIAGFDHPDNGLIRIGKVDVSGQGRYVAPNKRKIGMVFQDLALWPHLTVKQHLDFSMDHTKDRDEKTSDFLSLIGLMNHSKKYPHQLSGGEKQRLALGRALASAPQLLLLDEPLTSLDPLLREEIAQVILNVQTTLKFTMVYVTHDQREACMLSDTGAIMRAGSLEQIGKWHEIIAGPANHFVEVFTKGIAHEIKQ